MTEEQLRWSPVPSGITLISIIKHSINVELFWIQQVIAGRSPDLDYSDEDPDADWVVAPEETYEALKTRYLAVAEESLAILAGLSWDDPPQEQEARDYGLCVGWVVTHMVEEVARHCGHADLIRELIDGQVGE